uniref:IQ motif containing N n=1 Tax=Rhinolophus ferrumequinum TaxID=59479 RepID=A0A671FVK3_RHIFE
MLAQPVPNLQDKAGTLRPHPQHEPPASRETLLQQPDKMVPHHTPRLRAVVESQAFKNVLVDEMDIILSRAATLIQSNWKGYRLRQKLISQMRAAKAIQEAWRRFNTRRLLRFGKAVEKKVSADEGDIPYHPPQQVRFQHSEKDRSLSAPPIMVSKETQFPSADSLAAYTHQLAPQQPLGAPQASCAPGGPSITFLPDQTISSRLPCPVSPEAKRYPCLLTRTVRSANLVHREGDTIKTKQVAARANKAGAPGTPQSERYAQVFHGPHKTQTQALVEAEVLQAPPQPGPAPVMLKNPLQPCPVPPITMTKSPPQMYPAAVLTKTPLQSSPTATIAKTPPRVDPAAPVAKTTLQSLTKTPAQMRPTASMTNTAPQARLAAVMAKIPPQICLLTSIIKSPTQTMQTCPVPMMAKTPPQMSPEPMRLAATMAKTPLQTCPAATIAKTPSQTLPGASMTKTPPQTRLAAMITKTPAQLRSMATILRTLCLLPPTAGNLKASPPAVMAAGIPNTLSHTCLNKPKAKAVVTARQTVKISSHSYLTGGKMKYCVAPVGRCHPGCLAWLSCPAGPRPALQSCHHHPSHVARLLHPTELRPANAAPGHMGQPTWRGHFTRASLTTDALLGPAVWDNSQNTQWPGV